MDIDGFGKHMFYELGLLRSIRDIYQLDFDTISTLDGFGEKSVNNLQKQFILLKQTCLSIALCMGIRYVGKTNAKTLIAEVESILILAI